MEGATWLRWLAGQSHASGSFAVELTSYLCILQCIPRELWLCHFIHIMFECTWLFRDYEQEFFLFPTPDLCSGERLQRLPLFARRMAIDSEINMGKLITFCRNNRTLWVEHVSYGSGFAMKSLYNVCRITLDLAAFLTLLKRRRFLSWIWNSKRHDGPSGLLTNVVSQPTSRLLLAHAESVKIHQSGLDYHILSIMRTCYETVIVLWTLLLRFSTPLLDRFQTSIVEDDPDNVSSSCIFHLLAQ